MQERSHSIWVEKYRPDQLDSFIGNESFIEKVRTWITTNDIPQLLLYGKPGGGKTTLAKIIVNSIDCDYLYINASDERNIDLVRDKIKTFAATAGFRPLKVVILDESDFLNPTSTQPALRNLMETFSLHTRFILTCNYVERIIEPLQSRCQVFNIVPPSKSNIAAKLVEILNKENVEFNNEDIKLIINGAYPDIRKIINTAQQSSNNGKLVLDKSSIIESNYQLQILEQLKNTNRKEAFVKIREILAASGLNTFTDIYSFLYDNISEFAPSNVSSVILILAESQFQEPNALDKELHTAALMVKILNELIT